MSERNHPSRRTDSHADAPSHGDAGSEASGPEAEEPVDEHLAERSARRRRAARAAASGEPANAASPVLNGGGKVDLRRLQRAVRQAASTEDASRTEPQKDVDDDDAADARAFALSRASTDAAVDPAGRTFRTSAEDDDRPPVIAAEDEDGARTVQFELTRDLKKRLDKYLQDRVPFMSRTQLQRLIKEEGVTVNGRLPKASTVLRLGDVVTVVLPPPPSTEIPAENIPLLVLHEDADLIVLNKQPDFIVHPARSHKSGTVVNALAWHFQHRSSGQLSEVGREDARPGVVHRLDRHTTGAMVAAKSDTAHWRLGKQFSARTVDKRYLAVVHGWVEPLMDEIDLPIGKHLTIREMQAVRFDDAAKPALTIYRVREQYDGYALVELELKTGRTHQIRVHLSYLGWPIVGDDIYGGKVLSEVDIAPFGVSDASDQPLMARQALHATTLAFRHPTTRAHMAFTAPVWTDMARLIERLRAWRMRPISGPQAAARIGVFKPAGATVDLDLALRSPASL